MSERLLQAAAVIDIDVKGSEKIALLAKKIESVSRMARLVQKADGFASFDRQVRGIERATSAFGNLDRQIGALTRLDRVAGEVGRVTMAFERLDRAAMTGVQANHRLADSLARVGHASHLAAMAGPAILSGTRHSWQAGADISHSIVSMRLAGMSPEEITRARDLAGGLAHELPTMTVAELLELHKETRSSVQHADEAFHLLPELARAKAALKGMGIENAHLADIVKGGESLGLMTDPARFRRYLEGQVKSMAVMGRTITTEQIYEAAKYSKSAGATLSDDFLNLVLPSLIQEMHGSSAGDALSMLVKTLRGGMQSRHIPVEKMAELGLLAEPDRIVRTKTGSIKGYKGKVVGDDLLSASPDKWFAEVFKPAAEKAGYKTLSDQVRLLNMVLPQTAANLGRILLQQEETLKAHRRLYEGAPSLDTMVENLKDDPTAQLAALGHAVENFAGVLASPIMPVAARILDLVASQIGVWQERLATFQKEHPDAATALAGGALALGGAAGAVGTYGLLSGLVNGFGLKGSAVALDASAAALGRAAISLGAGGLRGSPIAGSPSGVPGSVPIPWVRTLMSGLLMGDLLGDIPEPGTPEWEALSKRVEERNARWDAWLRDRTPDWMKLLYGPDPRDGKPQSQPATGYATAGGFGGAFGGDGAGSPEGERAAQLRDWLDRRGGLVSPSGMSLRDYTLADRIQPPPGPETIPLPVPRPSDAEMAGFGDSLRESAQDFATALNSAFSGSATVSIEVKPGPMFDGWVRGIVKSEMGKINVTGPGSVGRTGGDIEGH